MREEHASVPGQRASLAVMAIVVVLSMTTWFSTSAIIPQLRTQWSLGTNEASLLIIAVQLGFVAGALISLSNAFLTQRAASPTSWTQAHGVMPGTRSLSDAIERMPLRMARSRVRVCSSFSIRASI